MSKEKERDGEEGFCGPPQNEYEESLYLGCIIKLPDGMYCQAEVIDHTENGIIFEVDPYYVQKGYFTERYLDSRYFDQLGLKYYLIPDFLPTEH